MKEYLIQILAGMAGSLGFSILFCTRKKYIVWTTLNAGISWSVYLLVNARLGDFAGSVFSAVCCSLIAAWMARRLCAPVVVLQMPAIVPMIPGGSLYYMMYYLFAGDAARALTNLLATARAIFGLAIGFAIVSVAFRAMAQKQKTVQKI